MKIQFFQMEFVELNILKDEILKFTNHQQDVILRTTDVSERYNRIIMHDIGRSLYFNFGSKIVNNLKSHGRTHGTFSVSVSEAALIQFVCGFPTTRNESETHTMNKISRIVDEKIMSLIY